MQAAVPQSHQLPACVCPANTGRDKQSMSKQTESDLFISSPFAKYAGLYQGLLRGVGTFQQLGNRLVGIGERAHAFRQFQLVREVGRILTGLPIKDFQTTGHYFLAVASNSCGKGDQQEARKLFELVADTASSRYKAKAILSLAGVSANTGNSDAELYYFTESLKASQDINTAVIAYRGIAVHKAREGYHRQAIRDLENLASLIKHAPASAYFDYLNSYAVELGTVGRLTEACNVIKVVLASPFRAFYPEWQETLLDLRSKHRSRSRVAISQAEEGHESQLEVSENALNKARVSAVIDFMKANFHRSIARAELAAAVNLSPTYVSHLFKAETGVSAGEYLIRLRMENAGQLLRTTFLSVKQVMAASGYNSKSHFTRHFKRQFSVVPSEYRKRFFHQSRKQ